MRETVVVAHGLWMPGIETRLLRHRLQRAGFRPELFAFPSLRGTLSQNAERMARFVERIDADRVHFVGHSLGGIITLEMLHRFRLKRIGRIVCLGSPLTGSGIAGALICRRFTRPIVGRSLTEHTARGGTGRWNSPHELGIIAGSKSLGVGFLFPGLPEPNDGTVAVEETQLEGAQAHITMPVSHTQLIIDREVARQAIYFLRHGSFRAGS